MRKRRLKHVVVIMTLVILGGLGCDSLRFAPGETQKQNAYLHHRTTQTVASQAQQEQTSVPLQQLSSQAAKQSEAILAYYGFPKEIPSSETVEQLLSSDNLTITDAARQLAIQRPDPWDVADNLLELGIALAGVVGGVYGTRAVSALKLAKQKSQALREIVQGNELFKQQNPELSDTFKSAQQQQSQETKTLVAALK